MQMDTGKQINYRNYIVERVGCPDSENRFHLRGKTSSLRQAHDIIFLLALMYSTYHTHNTSSLSDSKKNLSYRKKDFTVHNNNGIQFTAGAARDEARSEKKFVSVSWEQKAAARA